MTSVPITNSMVPLDVPLPTLLPRRAVLLRPDLLRPKKFRTLSSPLLYPFRFVLYRTKNLPLPIPGHCPDPSQKPPPANLKARLTADREKAITQGKGTMD